MWSMYKWSTRITPMLLRAGNYMVDCGQSIVSIASLAIPRDNSKQRTPIEVRPKTRNIPSLRPEWAYPGFWILES